MKTAYDVIIIGSGVGGMVCGNFFAKLGKKVLIVEQHDKPGGCVSAIERNGCVFDMGGHLFGSCNHYGVLDRCLSLLGVKIDFLQLNPSDRFFFPDMTIGVPTAIEEFRDILKQLFKAEKTNIDNFFDTILFIANNSAKKNVAEKYGHYTYQEYLDEKIRNNKLKSILSAQYLYIGTRPNRASLIYYSLLISSYLKDGVYYPKGGTQVFSDALSSKFKSYGGQCLFKTKVKKIIIKSNKALGIELENGDRYESKITVSNADATQTFENLIGYDMFPAEYISKFKKYTASIKTFMTFLSLSNFNKDLSCHRGWHFKSYDVNSQSAEPLYVFPPYSVDSTASKSADIQPLECFCEFPYNVKDITDSLKKDIQNKIVNRLETIIGKIHDRISFIDSVTPKTLERYTLNKDGSVYGWEMSPDQTANCRLQQETPIENLFLVGHWTVPGSGITSAAVSGWQLAKKLLGL